MIFLHLFYITFTSLLFSKKNIFRIVTLTSLFSLVIILMRNLNQGLIDCYLNSIFHYSKSHIICSFSNADKKYIKKIQSKIKLIKEVSKVNLFGSHYGLVVINEKTIPISIYPSSDIKIKKNIYLHQKLYKKINNKKNKIALIVGGKYNQKKSIIECNSIKLFPKKLDLNQFEENSIFVNAEMLEELIESNPYNELHIEIKGDIFSEKNLILIKNKIINSSITESLSTWKDQNELAWNMLSLQQYAGFLCYIFFILLSAIFLYTLYKIYFSDLFKIVFILIEWGIELKFVYILCFLHSFFLSFLGVIFGIGISYFISFFCNYYKLIIYTDGFIVIMRNSIFFNLIIIVIYAVLSSLISWRIVYKKIHF